MFSSYFHFPTRSDRINIQQLWNLLLEKFPNTDIVEGQIYNWHAAARRSLWYLDSKSAMQLLQKSEDIAVEVLQFVVPEGYKTLKEVMGKYATRLEEIAMDSTCAY